MASSTFLDGLKKAKELLATPQGLAELDSLIAQCESKTIQTTALVPDAELR
jgi:hypothetical protein